MSKNSTTIVGGKAPSAKRCTLFVLAAVIMLLGFYFSRGWLQLTLVAGGVALLALARLRAQRQEARVEKSRGRGGDALSRAVRIAEWIPIVCLSAMLIWSVRFSQEVSEMMRDERGAQGMGEARAEMGFWDGVEMLWGMGAIRVLLLSMLGAIVLLAVTRVLKRRLNGRPS